MSNGEKTARQFMADPSVDMIRLLDLVGRPAKDKVTEFTGTVTMVGFCIDTGPQVLLKPVTCSEGDMRGSSWFHVRRVEVDFASEPLVLSTENIWPQNLP